jgi:hypothetical protein
MSAPTMQAPAPRTARPQLLATTMDALIVLVWFAAAAVLGAVVWWQLTTLPKVTKAGDSGTLAPEELVKQVQIDGWFFVVAAIGGLLSGVALLLWRRRDPLTMVVLVALGGGFASWLMIRIGLLLGPGPVLDALRGLPEGAKVSTQLKLHAPGVAWIWPVAALLGALLELWILQTPDDDRR